MLKRRNTIHPLQEPAQWQPEHFKAKLHTNPFLSSSCDDMKKSAIYSTEEIIADQHTQVLAYKHTWSNTSTTKTNPFLLDETDISPNPFQINSIKSVDVQNDTPVRKNEKYKTHSRATGSRRMSLDLFKAPFGWHRRRRATCAFVDLDNMSSIAQSCEQVQEALRNSFAYSNQNSDDNTNQNNNAEGDVILKSSRYNPDEDQLGNTSYNHATEHQPYDHVLSNSRKRDSFNPFLNPDSNPDIPTFAHAHPADINDYIATRPDQQAPVFQNGGDKQSRHWRRRHSDFSVDDCPRLLELQRQHQQEQQRQRQEQEQEKEQQLLDHEVEQYQDISSSRMSLIKSTTDTALSSYCQNPRTSSYGPPPPSSTLSNPRRNSVVIGRNIIRPKLAVRSLYEPTSIRRYSEADHQYYPHDPIYSFNNTESCKNQDSGNTYPLSIETGQTSWESNSNVHPFDQPNSWQTRSIGRRESISYAQDFMKNNEPWVPRPWTTASISSCGSSPASPLYHSTFPHEREEYQDSQDELDQTVPTYHDMSVIQRKPYGQEDEYEEEQNETEYNNHQRELVYNFGEYNGQDRTYQVDENDMRFFYNSVDWKKEEATEEGYDQGQWQNTNNQPKGQSSRGSRLTRRATLAKNKIYKLLKQPQHQLQPESQIPQHQPQTQQILQFESDSDRVEIEGGNEEYDHQEREDLSRSNTSTANSTYSVTSSIRARMKLTPKTKTVLRHVKRRISTVAKTMISEASKAANTVTPILKSKMNGASKATSSQYESPNNSQQGSVQDVSGKIDEYQAMDHQEHYQHYHSGYNNEAGYPRHATSYAM